MNSLCNLLKNASIVLLLLAGVDALARVETARGLDVPLTGGTSARYEDRRDRRGDAAMVTFVADPGLTGPIASPACPAPDTEVLLRDDDQELTVTIPCDEWEERRNGFMYRDGTGARAGLRRITYRSGRLLIRFLGINYGAQPLTGPATYIEAELRIGATNYCGRFTDLGVSRPDKVVAHGPSSACTGAAVPTRTATASPTTEMKSATPTSPPTSPPADSPTPTATPADTPSATPTDSPTPLSHPPVPATGPQELYEDTSLHIQLMATDADGDTDFTFVITRLPDIGTLFQVQNDDVNAGAMISSGCPTGGGAALVNVTVTNPRGLLLYQPCTNGHGDPHAIFSYFVRDSTNTMSLTEEFVPITVLPVNDPPVAISTTHAGYDNEASFEVRLDFSDVDLDEVTGTILVFPTGGSLYRDTVAPANLVTPGSPNFGPSQRFEFVPDNPVVAAVPYTTFSWFVTDGVSFSPVVTDRIDILDAFSPPEAIGNPTAFDSFEGDFVNVGLTAQNPQCFGPCVCGDPDLPALLVGCTPEDLVYYEITQVPVHGFLSIPSRANMPITVPTAWIPGMGPTLGNLGMRYNPDPDFHTFGSAPDTFSFRVHNCVFLPGESTCTKNDSPVIHTVSFTVHALNDPPQITAPASATLICPPPATVALPSVIVTGISVDDDGGLIDLTLTAAGDAADLYVVDAAGEHFTDSGTTITMTGTPQQANTLLAGGLGYIGKEGTLTITVSDNGLFSEGPFVEHTRHHVTTIVEPVPACDGGGFGGG